MPHFRVVGGQPLRGEVAVAGAKNAALKLILAALLTGEEVRLSNVPEIADVARLVELLRALGVKVENSAGGHYTIRADSFTTTELSREHAPKIRVSTLAIGPLLAREGRVTLPHPGGCALGKRPIDLFIEGFTAFGGRAEEGEDELTFTANRLHAARFVFPFVSHTVTEALLMLASRVPGVSTLVNAAMEPEVSQLAEMLRSMGAKIKGDGTPTITIEGVERLAGAAVKVMPDRLEVGSFAALAAATRSELTITHCDPAAVEVPLAHLAKIGVPLEVGRDFVKIRPAGELRALNITTHEYPGFPTDLQAPFTVLLTQAAGESLVHETIFDGRLFYTDKLNTMGAKITLLDPHRAIVRGPTPLRGKHLESPDIRAGLALLVAALAAEGESKIENISQIDRGYERIEERLAALGANIRREE
ncbi:UDP-N-acetylglucosamine 1-carboxyvinyltransferase [Patescibacteria group bacterium]|nr:MAG: UDP-N-acetylglucosamine 1-carboxyvinyltransferase [Patescibacteria group bacterium]